MARIWTYQQYYNDFGQAWDGHVEAFSANLIEISFMDTLSSPSWQGLATGQFRQGPGGQISGTVTGYTFSFQNTLIYRFEGANLSAARLFALMEADSPALLGYVLSQADVFDLSSNSDIARGYGGNDVLNGNAGDDQLAGDAGRDRVLGGSGDDTLQGGAGRDTLRGDSGDDVLEGGAGADLLSGGYGADRFVFARLADSRPGAMDRVQDFARAEGDVIDLSALDAQRGMRGNQSFDLIGAAAFSGSAGELRWQRDGAGITVTADTDGDGRADFALHLERLATLRASDFVL